MERGLERTRSNGRVSPAFIPWHADLAQALCAAGDAAGAALAASTALELALACSSSRARADALFAAGSFEQAAALYQSVGAVLHEASALVALGNQPALERALELAARCGSTELERRARLGLAAFGAPARRRAATGPLALTPSERRVADLAAAGKMNKEIAQELFLTVKTVETHLAKTFQKLGVSSRTDVAPALAAV